MSKVQILESIPTEYTKSILSWEVVVLMFYGVFILMGALEHELWRDEAQSWLIARDMSFLQLFFEINYEGTPALWHLILMPFAKLGFPPSTITYIHIFIVFVTATLFITQAPFSKFTMVLFLFSFYMVWEYAIVARNYNLTVLLLFAIAANYKHRYTKPLVHTALIFLLFNTNVHSFFMALGLACLYLYETEKWTIRLRDIRLPIIIIGFGLLISVLQLIPAADNMRSNMLHEFNYLAVPRAIMNALFPIPMVASKDILTYTLYSLLAFSSLAILGYASLYLYCNSRQVFYIYMAATLWLFYLFVFKHFGGYRHHGFILIFLMFSLWISNSCEPNKKTKLANKMALLRQKTLRLLNLSFVFSIISGGFMHFNEQTMKYSGAQEMAAFLSTTDLTDKVIIGYPSTVASSLAPHLPNKKLWYPEIEDFGTYVVWNNLYANSRMIDFKAVEERVKRNHLYSNNNYLLLGEQLPIQSSNDYKLIYTVEQDIFGPSDERYYLYQISR